MPTYKHDFYQTDSHVTITLLIKNLKKDDVEINFTTDTLDCTCRLPDGNDHKLQLALFKPIISSECTWKISASKLEIVLKKKDNLRWDQLEVREGVKGSVREEETKAAVNDEEKVGKDDPQQEQVKSKKSEPRNWDKIVKEFEEEEKNKGESSGIDDMFKEIYEKGGEEVRRAMNKSFIESGGTVLSTNWNQVGEKKVECQPPDGCELKKWE